MSKPQVKILIIEDELNQANLIQFNLEQDGYEVYTAKDGEEGLTKAHEILPDLILLDWMIPKMSGPDVCRKIRKSRDIKETPIIMISAKSEEQDKVFVVSLAHTSTNPRTVMVHFQYTFTTSRTMMSS